LQGGGHRFDPDILHHFLKLILKSFIEVSDMVK